MQALHRMLLNLVDAHGQVGSADPQFDWKNPKVAVRPSGGFSGHLPTLLHSVTKMLCHAAELGERLLVSLHQTARNSPLVRKSCHRGLLAGTVELNPLTNANPLAQRLEKGGVPTREARSAVLRLAPSLAISRSVLDQGAEPVADIPAAWERVLLQAALKVGMGINLCKGCLSNC